MTQDQIDAIGFLLGTALFCLLMWRPWSKGVTYDFRDDDIWP